VDGKVMDGSEFLTLVDDIRREEYESGRKIAV
jgi:hypothetical protein